jgi:hypothetical protein
MREYGIPTTGTARTSLPSRADHRTRRLSPYAEKRLMMSGWTGLVAMRQATLIGAAVCWCEHA